MTVVFIHGVPETPSVWDDLRGRIDRPATALRLPGFGSPLPPGPPGRQGGVRRLAGDELRALGEPVDLVGHDWGAHLVMRIVSAYDVPVRSWVSDVAHGWHPDYDGTRGGHPLPEDPGGRGTARVLRTQTPGSPSFGDFLRPRGMSAELAAEVDTAHDEEMSKAILTLYRSAWPNFYTDWGKDFDHPASAPGLVLIPTGDPMAQPAMDLDMATRTGAQTAELDNLTHYWMLQDPDRGAEVLNRFWDSRPA